MKVEYKPKTMEDHYADIRRMFENWGATVLGITVEYDDSCDPGTGFIVTLRGRETEMNKHFAGQVLTNYAYRIEWAG